MLLLLKKIRNYKYRTKVKYPRKNDYKTNFYSIFDNSQLVVLGKSLRIKGKALGRKQGRFDEWNFATRKKKTTPIVRTGNGNGRD